MFPAGWGTVDGMLLLLNHVSGDDVLEIFLLKRVQNVISSFM